MSINKYVSALFIMLLSATLINSCAEDKKSLPDAWACVNDELECSGDCPAEISAETELDCETGEITVSIKIKNPGESKLENIQLHSQYITEGREDTFLPESDFSSPGPGVVDFFHTIETLEAGESALVSFMHRFDNIDMLQLEGAIVEDIRLCIPNQATLVLDDEIYYCE